LPVAAQSSLRHSRNTYLFGATSLLNDTASEMTYWVLPAFLVSLGAGPGTLGLIEGVAESMTAVAKLYSGWLADRTARRKPLVVAGYALSNAAKPLLAMATAPWHVLVVRFADRLAKGVRAAPRDVMLVESEAPERLGSAFGLLQALDSAGAIVGPALALVLLRVLPLRGVFWMAAIPGLLSVLVVALLVREPRRDGAVATASKNAMEAPASRSASVAATQRLPGSFYYVLAAVALFSIGNSSDMFLVLRARDVGIGAAMAPLLGLVFNITFTAASWPAGRLADRVPKAAVAAAGYMVFAVTYAAFALAPGRGTIWAAMAVYGLFYALTNPVLRALIAGAVPAAARGRAFGIFYFATSIAALAASLLTGALWERFGARVPFLFSAGLAMAAALMLLMYVPRQSRAAAT